MLHVAILVHCHDEFEKNGYWLKEFSDCWREKGMRVSVVRGADSFVEADLAVLHIDLTVVPGDYLEIAQRYPKVVNGEVFDTSKRLSSSHVVRRDDAYEGPVIVKTNRNFQGIQEARLAVKGLWPRRRADIFHNYRIFFKEAWRAARGLLWHGHAGAFHRYSVYASVREVPNRVWSHPDLIVERFLPERRGEYYCVRSWLFLGDRERSALFYSKHPIVKSRNIVRQETLSEVPEDLRRIRSELKFDFGKFDYTVHDGQAVLFDANRTPTLGTFSRERYLPMIESLSEGVRDFL